mgnify:CR=1 FL=1
MAHGYMYEKHYIMHEIGGRSIVAFESYVTGCRSLAIFWFLLI